MTLKMKAHLVDGGLAEFTATDDDLRRYRRLKQEGCSGVQIIHSLLSDDWGAPPSHVRLIGHDSEGNRIDIRIPYDQDR